MKRGVFVFKMSCYSSLLKIVTGSGKECRTAMKYTKNAYSLVILYFHNFVVKGHGKSLDE